LRFFRSRTHGEVEKARDHQQQDRGDGRRWFGLRSVDNIAGAGTRDRADGEIAVSDDAVSRIGDLQDAIAGHRPG
jgi:hypothetical protein